jgi:hypothetical protein
MFELSDSVFYSKLLAFQIGDRFCVGQWPGYFLAQSELQAPMLGPELLDILRKI